MTGLDYAAYGLIWRMPLTCPELRVAPAGSTADVTVRYGELPAAPAHALAAGPLRRAWVDVQAEATALTTHRAGSILLRGLLAGLFLNRE